MGAVRLQSSNRLRKQIAIRRYNLKKCLVIAPLEAHATIGRLAAIASSGVELHVIDVSNNPLRFELNQYPFTEIKSYKYFDANSMHGQHSHYLNGILSKLRGIGLVKESRAVVKCLTEDLNRVKPDVVITYYGPIGIQYAKIVKIINGNIPVVSIMNLIPSSLDYQKTITGFFLKIFNSELNTYKKTIPKLNFVICASKKMKGYIAHKYGVDSSRMEILPDYFPETMNFYNAGIDIKLPDLNLIFLGAPERWGGALDNIDRQLFELASSGISIYSGNLAQYVKSTTNAFSYPFFSDREVFSGSLSSYAHNFKASLITYGIDERHERFKTTLPTRFFSALAAGIPIVVKAGMFDAVEAYVDQYQIGFSYRNAEELKLNLLDQNTMDIYRNNVIQHCKEFYAESQGVEFEKIFNKLIFN